MREYCRVIAEHLSQQAKFRDQVDGDYVQLIYMTSPLHDIGKVGIPDRILLKPGKLTPRRIRDHEAARGNRRRTLDAAVSAHPEAKFLCMARDIARCHHEKFDGSGYPDGLAGEDIPLCGRIVALADVYDALTTKRVYKPAFSHEKAVAIIREGRGRHFDPDIVDAFEANEERFVAIREQLAQREEQEAQAIAQRQAELVRLQSFPRLIESVAVSNLSAASPLTFAPGSITKGIATCPGCAVQEDSSPAIATVAGTASAEAVQK